MMSTAAKHEFLVAYDYGMGGLWGVILARSPDDILSKYPELKIPTERPKWLTQESFDKMRSEDEILDIDDPPRGLLTAVVSDRDHG
jgi:hypothetical protein